MKQTLFFLLIVAIFSVSCGLPATIIGNILIIVDDNPEYRLSGASVSAIPEDTMKPFIVAKKAEYETNYNDLVSGQAECNKNPAGRDCSEQFDQGIDRLRSMYFDNPPAASAIAKTDEDGKFELPVKKKGRYALMANGVGPDGEKFYWIVWVNADEMYKPVVLSEHNRLMSQTPDQILSGR